MWDVRGERLNIYEAIYVLSSAAEHFSQLIFDTAVYVHVMSAANKESPSMTHKVIWAHNVLVFEAMIMLVAWV